jgi:hypothetical protein
VRFGHVAEIAEYRHGVQTLVVGRRGERVIDEVAVERLVIVGVAGELRPRLALIQMNVVAA